MPEFTDITIPTLFHYFLQHPFLHYLFLWNFCHLYILYPTAFVTNASESINALIKNKVNYKKSELPVFLDKLKEVIEEQERELQRAVINRGKYQLAAQYQSFQIDEQQWFLRM